MSADDAEREEGTEPEATEPASEEPTEAPAEADATENPELDAAQPGADAVSESDDCLLYTSDAADE